MNPLVILFFAHTTLATALLGGRFLSKRIPFARYFGIALLLDAVAFGVWGTALVLPAALPVLVTIGAVSALISFVFFLKAGMVDLPTSIQYPSLAAATAFVAATFYVGRYVFPTPKFISGEGFLFFNMHPFVQVMYIAGLLLTTFLAIEKIGTVVADRVSILVKFLLVIQVIGTIVLITNIDTLSLLVVGWCMGLSYFALWTMLLFRKGIWLD